MQYARTINVIETDSVKINKDKRLVTEVNFNYSIAFVGTLDIQN
jgi:hypothetical protein